MKIQNTFTSGKMNKDVDERLMPKGEYRDALNVKINNSNGSDVGAIENSLSNASVSSLSLGSNPTTIGVVEDDSSNSIYWCVVSSSGSYICEYVKGTGASIILSDERVSGNILNFQSDSLIDMAVINDAENDRTILFLTDGVNEPKYFTVDGAKALTNSSFELEDVSVIKSAPYEAPSFALSKTTSLENNIEDKFYAFSYRYIYENDDVSALSPFSNFAFMPDNFSYDYSAGTNKSMFNDYNKIELSVDTGSSRVKEIEVVAKIAGNNTYYVVEKINKQDKGLSDDSTYNFEFQDNKIFKALPESQVLRLYDNVPIKAKTVEVMANRIMFGNYIEGYDIKSGSTPIKPKLTLSYSSTNGTEGVPHTTMRTNMDYEIAIAYVDGKGRMTTPFTSEDNTINIPFADSNKKNKLEVSVESKAPDWATGYRFFVKQSRNDYDVISPVVFHLDGIYVWVKIEGEDINKVREGDFLFVKSDISGPKEEAKRTKVLEATYKDRNFLEKDTETATKQQSGNYIKLSTDDIDMTDSSVVNFEYKDHVLRSASSPNDFGTNTSYVEDEVHYGEGFSTLQATGTYTGSTDKRFELEIIDTSGGTDRYRMRYLDCSENEYSDWEDNGGAGYLVTTPRTVDGLTFSATLQSGGVVGDRTIISAKSAARANEWDWSVGNDVGEVGRRAIMNFRGKTTLDETIPAGTVIEIDWDDDVSPDGTYNLSGYTYQRFVATKDYANIEEWWWEDNVMTKMSYPESYFDIMFRRGTLAASGGGVININSSGDLYMCILSEQFYKGGDNVQLLISNRITEYPNKLLLETDYKNAVSEIFYELPHTYGIDSSGNHLGKSGDTNQVFGTTDAVITLDYYNAFGWYNGYESIKIGDAFNEVKMLNNSKPLVPVDNYKSIHRFASITYSGLYESTTSFNALNEFNLANANYKDLDYKNGKISKLLSKNGDLLVFQENAVSRVLVGKNVLYSADGGANVSQTKAVLGQDVPYTGQFGVTDNPYSVTVWGSRVYFADEKRSSVNRLSVDGINKISDYGMRSWFRDNININSVVVAGYDPSNDQYVVNISNSEDNYTVTFDEKNTGWTSFHSYAPEMMVALNNDFYSFKDGQVYIHNQSSSTRNSYYGQASANTEIEFVVNDGPSDVKLFKSVELEGNTGNWTATIATDLDAGHINPASFEKKEGKYWAYIRRNQSDDLNPELLSVQGIGNVTGVSGSVISFSSVPSSVRIGDSLYHTDGSSNLVIGTITTISGGDITVDSVVNTPSVGEFAFATKDPRAESFGLRGYYSNIRLVNDDTGSVELFAVNNEIVKSFP